MHVDAFRHESLEVLGGHLLVVEGESVGTGRGRAERIEVVVVPEDDVGADLSCRLVGTRGEDAKSLSEFDCGLVSHSGELPAADHRHHGHSGRRRARSGGARFGTCHGSPWCHVARIRSEPASGPPGHLLGEDLWKP